MTNVDSLAKRRGGKRYGRGWPLLVLAMTWIGIHTPARDALGADHAEAPAAVADPAADLADVYAWHQGNKLVTVVTFAGLSGSAMGALYDDDVLYTVHLDQDGDNAAEIEILVRFGANAAGEWGMRVENLPGSPAPIEGPVETLLDAGDGRRVWAGWRDDPFFFDLQGFRETLQTQAVAFDSSRDSLAGLNVTAIVLESDLAAAGGGNAEPLRIWATTARK